MSLKYRISFNVTYDRDYYPVHKNMSNCKCTWQAARSCWYTMVHRVASARTRYMIATPSVSKSPLTRSTVIVVVVHFKSQYVSIDVREMQEICSRCE
jgi:hypothetical protein